MESRFQATLLGGVIGDLIGAAHEGVPLRERPTDEQVRGANHLLAPLLRHAQHVHDKHGGWVRDVLESDGYFARAEMTDDSHQLLSVAESVAMRGGFDLEFVARRLVDWYDGGRAKGIGGTTTLGLMLVSAGVSPLESGEKALLLGDVHFQGVYANQTPTKNPEWRGIDSHDAAVERIWHSPATLRAVDSNGGLVRIAPAGLFFHNRPMVMQQVVTELSSITHAGRESVDCARVMGHLVSSLSHCTDKDVALRDVRSRYPVANRALLVVEQEAVEAGAALTTLGIALEAFRRSESFEDAMVLAVNPERWTAITNWGEYNGAAPDTDTYGCVVGAIAGAAYGVEAIPQRWLDAVEDGSHRYGQPGIHEICELANTIYRTHEKRMQPEPRAIEGRLLSPAS